MWAFNFDKSKELIFILNLILTSNFFISINLFFNYLIKFNNVFLKSRIADPSVLWSSRLCSASLPDPQPQPLRFDHLQGFFEFQVWFLQKELLRCWFITRLSGSLLNLCIGEGRWVLCPFNLLTLSCEFFHLSLSNRLAVCWALSHLFIGLSNILMAEVEFWFGSYCLL